MRTYQIDKKGKAFMVHITALYMRRTTNEEFQKRSFNFIDLQSTLT